MFACRFPVVTWRHAVTKAVLLRSSGFHSKGVIGVFKGHYSSPPTSKSCDRVHHVQLSSVSRLHPLCIILLVVFDALCIISASHVPVCKISWTVMCIFWWYIKRKHGYVVGTNLSAFGEISVFFVNTGSFLGFFAISRQDVKRHFAVYLSWL